MKKMFNLRTVAMIIMATIATVAFAGCNQSTDVNQESTSTPSSTVSEVRQDEESSKEVSKEDLISNINSYKYISAVYQYPISNWSELYSALNNEEKDMHIKLTGDCVWDASVNSGEVPLSIDKGKKVTVDLNGHVIDRNLNEVAANGYVIEVVNAGVEIVVAGSAVFKADDIEARTREFVKLIGEV